MTTHEDGSGNGFDRSQLHGTRMLRRLAEIRDLAQREAVERGLEYGLEAAPSVQDRTISTFARGGQPARAVLERRLRHERAPSADPDDLPVVLEDRKRLSHHDAADGQAPGQLVLGWEQLARQPEPRLDLFFDQLLKLIVQGNKTRSTQPAGVKPPKSATAPGFARDHCWLSIIAAVEGIKRQIMIGGRGADGRA